MGSGVREGAQSMRRIDIGTKRAATTTEVVVVIASSGSGVSDDKRGRTFLELVT